MNSKKSKLTFPEVRQEFYHWRQVFEDIVADIKASRRKRVLYNMDFAYLFDYIWDKPAVDVPAWVPGGRNLFAQFIRHHDQLKEFKLVFTGPSYYELLDSIKHKLNEVKGFRYSAETFYKRVSDALEKTKNFDDIDAVFAGSGISKTLVNYLPSATNNFQIEASFKKIRDVFGHESILTGIADHIKSGVFERHWDTFKESYRALLDSMMQRRPQLTGDTRSAKDRKFHYGVDSSNITTTINTNTFEDDFRMLFVTQPRLRRRYCQQEGRSPYVPFFRTAAKLLERDNTIGSSEDYFNDLLNKAQSITRELEKTTDLEALPRQTIDSIIDFFETDMRYLGTSGSKVDDGSKHTLESLRRIFRSKDDVEAAFDKAKATLDSMAGYLVSRYPIIGDKDPIAKIMEHDEEDKVMKEIRNAFLKQRGAHK